MPPSFETGLEVPDMTTTHGITPGTPTGKHRLAIYAFCNVTHITAVTLGGVSMTNLFDSDMGGAAPYCEIWYLVNAPATYQAIGLTPAASARGAAQLVTYLDVDPTNPFLGTSSTYRGTSSGPSDDVTSYPGWTVFDLVGAYGVGGTTAGAPTVGPGQYDRGSCPQTSSSTPGCASAVSDEPGATTVTMSWSAGGGWAKSLHIYTNLKPYVGVPPPFFEYTIDIRQPGVRATVRMSLADVFNRVWVRYKLSSGGSTVRSTVQEDSASVARFGVKELVISAGELESSLVADQIAQSYLNRQAWPKPRPLDLTLGRDAFILDQFGRSVSPWELKTNRWCRILGFQPPTMVNPADAVEDPAMFYIEGKEVDANGTVKLVTDPRQYAEAILARAAGKRSL